MTLTNKRPTPPCTKDCPDRSGTCHGSCQKYLEFVEANELFKAERANIKDVERPFGHWSQTNSGHWRYKR